MTHDRATARNFTVSPKKPIRHAEGLHSQRGRQRIYRILTTVLLP